MHRVFFHGSDFDGWASAAIYALRKKDVALYPVDYGEKMPLEVVEKNDIVAILDYCPDDFEEIQRIMEIVPVFYWIDHHKTSRKMYKEHRFADIHTPPGLFITDSEKEPRAACVLTYMYLHGVTYEEVPYYIRLLGMWDIHDFSDKQTLPFQYAMRAWLGHPMEKLQQWKKLIKPSKSDHQLFQKLIDAGRYIILYEEKKNKKEAKKLCFEMEFEGYKTIAVNRILLASDFFKDIYNPKIHDLMLQFGYIGDGQWKLSFRSETIDCAELAERFNGGGHAGASGVVVNDLPKELKKLI